MGGAQEEREGEGEAGSRVGPLVPGFAKGRVGHGQRDVRPGRGLLPRAAEPEGDPEPLGTGSRKTPQPCSRSRPPGPARLARC